MVKVNPEILLWARFTAGLSIEEACQKLGIRDIKGKTAVDQLSALENGSVFPTRPMLIKMAKQYHRPLIIFFMSKPPKKGNRGQDFRTLPNEISPISNALVDVLIRNVLARHSIIHSELEDEEDAFRLTYVKSLKIADGVQAAQEEILKHLNFNIREFYKKSSQEEAFAYLRSCAEEIGIFVLLIGDLGSHHTNITTEIFRGFSIADDIAPFIVINDNDSKAAWSFTLLHEIVHIWLGQTGVDNTNFDNKIEQFCNTVASEILLPKEEIQNLFINHDFTYEDIFLRISKFSIDHNLSSSMVAYKLFQIDFIDRETWIKLDKVFRSLWNENRNKQRSIERKRKSGPDYYVVRRYLIGKNLLSTVQRLINGGLLTTTKASKVLGVKAKNVQKLLEINGLSKIGKIS